MNRALDLIQKGLRNPRGAFWFMIQQFKPRRKWQGNENIQFRIYSSYSEYVAVQKSKLKTLNLKQYDEDLKNELVTRMKPIVKCADRVVCLAARAGGEVRAFRELGCFAIGIDLEPGKGNEYVLTGDFHNIKFPDGCVDVIYSNSLDHVLDYERLFREIKRLLSHEGILVVDINRGTEDEEAQVKFGYYEANQWKSYNDVIRMFEENGFRMVRQDRISFPWPGKQVVFKVENNSGE